MCLWNLFYMFHPVWYLQSYSQVVVTVSVSSISLACPLLKRIADEMPSFLASLAARSCDGIQFRQGHERKICQWNSGKDFSFFLKAEVCLENFSLCLIPAPALTASQILTLNCEDEESGSTAAIFQQWRESQRNHKAPITCTPGSHWTNPRAMYL